MYSCICTYTDSRAHKAAHTDTPGAHTNISTNSTKGLCYPLWLIRGLLVGNTYGNICTV